MANSYDKGDKVRLKATFRNDAGALADPTTVTCRVLAPDGTKTAYTYAGAQVIKDAVGSYHLDLSLIVSGVWQYRWEGTGMVETAEESWLSVRGTAF